jgi:hypothetical protein
MSPIDILIDDRHDILNICHPLNNKQTDLMMINQGKLTEFIGNIFADFKPIIKCCKNPIING